MKRQKGTVLTIVVLLAVLLSGAGSTGAQSGAPTVVSYQGQVAVGGSPYDGDGYFKFAIVDGSDAVQWSNAAMSGDPPEPSAAVTLAVTNGLFNVLLGDISIPNMTALPASAFGGTERYLRVWFSSDGSTFTLLSPDRRIAAVPYALQAEEAKLAGDADTLDSYHASAFQQHYANVVIVAKSGGDFTSIQAALNSITTASDTNRYLVRVMPGIYTERVTMKQYVDIEGSGELTTRITFTGSASYNTGTVIGANEAELRFLTVANTGAAAYAVAIYNTFASPRLTNVTTSATGGTSNNFVVHNYNASPIMTGVTISAPGGGFGVYNYNASPIMTNVTVSVTGIAGASLGLYNWNSSPRIRTCTITSSGYGIYNTGVSSTLSVDNSQVAGDTATIYNNGGLVLVGASLLSGGGVGGSGTVTCAGVYDENYTFYASTCP